MEHEFVARDDVVFNWRGNGVSRQGDGGHGAWWEGVAGKNNSKLAPCTHSLQLQAAAVALATSRARAKPNPKPGWALASSKRMNLLKNDGLLRGCNAGAMVANAPAQPGRARALRAHVEVDMDGGAVDARI